ncbi:unnamed protein product [Larinioides sclopetarius]|uniref:Uncharacterized protein n=1 Tax=Larinioides sclopetarius TaxID=280406 RepID=A0AAV2ADK2_9ARAC
MLIIIIIKYNLSVSCCIYWTLNILLSIVIARRFVHVFDRFLTYYSQTSLK